MRARYESGVEKFSTGLTCIAAMSARTILLYMHSRVCRSNSIKIFPVNSVITFFKGSYMGFYKKIILFLIFISGLAMLIAKLCLAQEDSSLFVQNQDIKQKIYSNNRETETIAKDLNSIENEMDDAHLMVSAEEIKQDTIIAQKIIFLIDSLATKEVEKESLVEQNKSLTQKMLSLISEKQTEKANLTRQNQVLTQKITSLINALA